MARVMRWKWYDINTNEAVISPRMGTKEAIEAMGKGCVPLEGTAIEVDDSVLDGNELTPRDFKPRV